MKTLKVISGLLLVFFISNSLFFTSCSKDDDEDKEKTKTELITSSKWVATSFVMTSTDTTMDATSDPEFYFKILLKDDGTYTIEENFETPSTDSGKWEFNSGETSVLFDKGTDDEITFTIVKLTEDELEITAVDEGETMTIKMKH